MISNRISNNIPPQNENFEYVYTHSIAILHFCLKLECCKPYKAACHPTKCDIFNDLKLFPTISQDILMIIFDIIKSCRITKASALECSFMHIVNKSCFIESLYIM